MQGDDPVMAVDTEMEPVMPLILVCKQGHQWKVARESRDSVSVCPHCGQVGETICTIEATHANFSKADVELEDLEYPPFREAVSPDRSFRFKPPSLVTTPIADIHFPGFEIESKLGEGGMGIVYCARELKLNRRVALKVLLSGRAALPTELERFQVEAESVAKLRHENIVQIYQVGEFEGVPFFAMELIDGPNLEAYTKAKPIGDRKSAALVETLASTLHHAHQHGIVHRDIKPQNVLITKDGQPKIADFGLAKHLDRESGQTKSGSVIGTPNYMAPEQAAGKSSEAGPVTDVYALGGVLYYLITGRPPFQSETVVDTLRLVVESDPPSPRILNPSVNRDLQTICLKCLEKEPAKRYASAGELADDLARFLDNRPIIARPIGPVQRLGRWCRRSPRVAALSFALLFVVLIGTTGIFVKWREAEQQREQAVINLAKARQTVNEFYVVISENELLNVEGMQPLRATLLQKALVYYRDLLQQESGELHAESDVASTWYRIGKITFGHRVSVAESVDAYRNSLRIYDRLLEQDPDNPVLRASLAEVHSSLAIALAELGNYQDAMKSLTLALTIQEALREEFPDDITLTVQYVTSLNALADRHNNTGQNQLAFQANAKALVAVDEALMRWADQLLAEDETSWYQFLKDPTGGVLDPMPLEILGLVEAHAGLHNQLGLFEREQGKLETAAEHYLGAIADVQELIEIAPDSQTLRQDLAGYSLNLANVYDELHDSRAKVHYQESVKILRELAEGNPAVNWYQHRLATVLLEQGIYEKNQDNLDEADQLLVESIEIGRAVMAKSPDVATFRSGLAHAYQSRGAVGGEAGNYVQAKQAIGKAIELLERLVLEDDDSINFTFLLANAYHCMGMLLNESGQAAEAKPFLTKAIGLREPVVLSNPEIIGNRTSLINHYGVLDLVYLELGDLELSEKTNTRLIELCDGLIADDVATDYAAEMSATAYRDRARVRTNLKRFDLAIEDWNACIRTAQQPWPDYYHACRVRTIALSGDHPRALQQSGKFEPANEGGTMLMQARALGTISLALAEDTSLDDTERNRQITGLAKQATSLLKTIANEELLDDLPEQLKVEACQQDFSALSKNEEFREFLESLQMDKPLQLDDDQAHLRQ